MIIGISGYMGSGKDTVAKIIQDLTKEQWVSGCVHYDESLWEIKKFAGKLKEMVSLMTGIPVEDLEKEEVKASTLPKEWWCAKSITGLGDEFITFDEYERVTMEERNNWWPIHPTVRDILQRLGTDCVRDRIHKNAWVNALFADYKPLLQSYIGGGPTGEPIYPKWIISDMRFPNEMEAIKERGGLTIRVIRPDGGVFDSAFRHESETALDKADLDYVIVNNGSLEELSKNVKTMLEEFKLI